MCVCVCVRVCVSYWSNLYVLNVQLIYPIQSKSNLFTYLVFISFGVTIKFVINFPQALTSPAFMASLIHLY
jgi:hypothetical protein